MIVQKEISHVIILQFFVVVVGLLTFFSHPDVLCVKAIVNFQLIGHIISVLRNLSFLLFYYCFVGHVLFCPTEYICIFWNCRYVWVSLWETSIIRKNYNKLNNTSSHFELVRSSYPKNRKRFVPCHVSLNQPWLNWVKSVNMNSILLSNKQKNIR